MEHLNNIIMAGPISQFKIDTKRDAYGSLKVTFLVGTGAVSIKVTVRMKKDWLMKRGQTAKSVVVGNGYMNGWYRANDKSVLLTNVGGRESGLSFLDTMIDPYALATVEGYASTIQGNWVVLQSSYRNPSQNEIKQREVPILLPGPCPAAKGAHMLVVGVPKPKFGDNWYAHVEAQRFWLL